MDHINSSTAGKQSCSILRLRNDGADKELNSVLGLRQGAAGICAKRKTVNAAGIFAVGALVVSLGLSGCGESAKSSSDEVVVADVSGVKVSEVGDVSGVEVSEVGDVSGVEVSGVDVSEARDVSEVGDTSEDKGLAIEASVFPDEIFREYIGNVYDVDRDGFLTYEEISSVTEITVRESSDEKYKDITTVKGIELFPELTSLSVMGTGITELDISGNPKLTYLQCSDTDISSINNASLPELRWLQIAGTKIDSIDVSVNPELEELDICNTAIAEVDVTTNAKLMAIHCLDCKNLKSLDVLSNPHIQEVSIAGCDMTTLDVTGCEEISAVTCDMDDEIVGCDERLILRRG